MAVVVIVIIYKVSRDTMAGRLFIALRRRRKYVGSMCALWVLYTYPLHFIALGPARKKSSSG